MLDKTWQEIHDAILVGGAAIQGNDSVSVVSFEFYTKHEGYGVGTGEGSGYVATSASGYPTTKG